MKTKKSNMEEKIIVNSQIVDVKPVNGVVRLKHTLKSDGKKVTHEVKQSNTEERKDKIEIIIDKIKVCFWEHEDFDDIRVREILEQELDRAREEGYQNGYENGLEDLHSNDIYQEAVCSYGEWSQEGMDKGFEEARKELLSKLIKK